VCQILSKWKEIFLNITYNYAVESIATGHCKGQNYKYMADRSIRVY